MTYKLNPEVKKIQSPVVVKFSNQAAEMTFANGAALADAVFDRYYLIESLAAESGSVVLTLRENDTINAVNWAGEEAVSFF